MSDTDMPRVEPTVQVGDYLYVWKGTYDQVVRELAQARQDGIAEGRRQMPAESVPPLHPVVQECIDNYGKYYAEQHKLA